MRQVPRIPLEAAGAGAWNWYIAPPACENNVNDDGDTVVNDGCPTFGVAEATCADGRR